MRHLFLFYRRSPMVMNVGAFVLGVLGGVLLWKLGTIGILPVKTFTDILSPFGNLLLLLLKMIVVPVIFFSLVSGTASLPLHQFGKMGLAVILWYLATSCYASGFGTAMAYWLSPTMTTVQSSSTAELLTQVTQMQSHTPAGGNPLLRLLFSLFQNPFQALAEGSFLPIIVFSILFGLAARTLLDTARNQTESETIRLMLRLFDAFQMTTFKLIDWVMLYFPIGVLALTTVNFANYGVGLFSSYAQIAGCVIVSVLLMLLICYPLFIFLLCRENPYTVLWKLREPILTAFVTRSSAATLPVSLKTAREEFHIQPGLSGFTLPLGATVNMDGVCIHLPVFAILAANLFQIELTVPQLLILILSVVFASVGAGGIPGGSIFLLFLVLENMGLKPEQISLVVALALGINPLMDMFETACNVAGDNVGNYVIARKLKMQQPPEP